MVKRLSTGSVTTDEEEECTSALPLSRSECLDLVPSLSEANVRLILKELLMEENQETSLVFQKVQEKIQHQRNQPLDLTYFGSATFAILHQLDHLPSNRLVEEFSVMQNSVSHDLGNVLKEAKRLSHVNAFHAIVRMVSVICLSQDVGKLWKYIVGDGGFISTLATDLLCLIQELEPTDISQVEEDVNSKLVGYHNVLKRFGARDFYTVISMYNLKKRKSMGSLPEESSSVPVYTGGTNTSGKNARNSFSSALYFGMDATY